MDRKEILRIIDEIIENTNKIKDFQKKIDAKVIDDKCSILVYDEELLLQYAEAAGKLVKESGYISNDGLHNIGFSYKGYDFVTYVTRDQLLKIREKVLPPTKVTEPNQNA